MGWLAAYQNEIIGGLIVWVITLIVGASVGALVTKQRFERKYDAAADQYVRRISEAINAALDSLDSDLKIDSDPRRAYLDARIIVGIRDSLRDSLTSINSLLNSEIDRLATLVRETEQLEYSRGEGGDAYFNSLFAIRETIRVLGGVWQVKAEQVRIEIRKLLTELGLVER